jgi:organic radical activating enzyme
MNELNIYDPEVAYIDGKSRRNIKVYWILGNICTYRCSYCIPKFYSGNSPFHNTQVVQDTLKKLPPCDVLLGGGEPTYHPDIEKIILEKPDYININLLSNGARPIAFWERITPMINAVFLSYHLEYANLDRFIAIADLIYNVHKKLGKICLMMLPDRWDECIAVYNILVAAGFSVTTKAIMDNWQTVNERYTSEQISWISESAYPVDKWVRIYNHNDEIIYRTDPAEMVSKNMNRYTGWTCHVPNTYVRIDEIGNVSNTCCNQGANLSNIFTGFTLSKEPIICKLPMCTTYSDLEGIKSSPSFTGTIPGI